MMSLDARPTPPDDDNPLDEEAETLADDATPVTWFDPPWEEGEADEGTAETLSEQPASGFFTMGDDSYSASCARVPSDSKLGIDVPDHPVHSLMIVEDDAWAARLLLTLLKNAIPTPLAFVQARTLSEGIERLGSHRIQLILTDLGLPDSNIAETVPRLHQAAPGIPVIVLSAHEDEDLRKMAIENGAAAYLVKGKVSNETIVSEILTRLDSLPALEDPAE